MGWSFIEIMRKFVALIIAGSIIVVALVGFISLNYFKKEVKEYNNYHFSLFNSNQEEYGNLDKFKIENKNKDKVYGGIVSHHFLMREKIAEFFAKFENQDIETVVILGPNHFGAGNHNILVSRYPYKSPWGVMYPDEEVINKILDEKIAFSDEKPFEREHSISTLTGFAKYYLPKALIVPIILKSNTNSNEAEELAHFLSENLSKKSVVVASVDFSHHLNNIGAQYHDNLSTSVIESFDFDRIYDLEIDSPPSVYTLLKYLEGRGAQDIEYISTNSATNFNSLESEDVTSYMFAHFKEGGAQNDKKVSILSFGDMMFARGVARGMEMGIDVFEKIKGVEGNFFKGMDLITANLEGPITSSSVCEEKDTLFRFDLNTAEILSKNKISAVNLANNHIVDCYETGVRDTEKILNMNGVDFFGSPTDEKYLIKDIGSQKIALVGFDFTLNSDHLEKDVDLVERLKAENDLVIVNAHWGIEYREGSNGQQQNIGHQLIEAGADVIIGHHPHVVQEVEMYRGRPIFYSLGNFIFDQSRQDNREGFGVGLVAGQEKLEFYIFPYEIKKYQPELLDYDNMIDACGDILGDLESDVCYFGVGR